MGKEEAAEITKGKKKTRKTEKQFYREREREMWSSKSNNNNNKPP